MNAFKKQLSIQLGVAFLMVAAAVAATQFAAGSLTGNAQKILNQKSELAFRIRATQQLASLKADSEKAQPLFTILDNVLPAKDSLINFGQSMIELAKSEKLDLAFTFGGETAPKGDTPGFIRFSITGSGSYESFQRFLTDLEKSRLFVKINSVDLTRQSGGVFNLVADGQVFYQ